VERVEVRAKKAVVFGLGRSGVGAANLLAGTGADVTVSDRKSGGELNGYLHRLSPSVKLCLGGYPQDMKGVDLIVVSPGVPLEIEPIRRAREQGIKVIGELEFAYQALKSEELRATGEEKDVSRITRHASPPFLAVTGSNGKSTTTTLLDLMLRKAGFTTLLGGNIGNALTEGVSGARHSTIDFVVAEVSSFQLETIDEFKPRGATILNITPDHLDRYHSMDEYSDTKAAIFRNQDGSDFLVLNADDQETMKIRNRNMEVGRMNPRVYFFSRREEIKGVYFKDGVVRCNIPEISLPSSHFPLIDADEIRVRGVHNLENAMASSAMALLAGCPPDAAAAALREFPGLEHRLEFVRELDGVRYINDSKGTNVGAVMKSLEGFTSPVLLIAGGRDKAGDFTPMGSLIREKVKALILIGEAAEKIGKALGGLTTTVFASDMKEAVDTARRMTDAGDVVLLSPACASFDMFRDFEDRGEQFKKIVRELF
jgi:UDP-N-acetylmuramoylalanine--D-glutamate ligase